MIDLTGEIEVTVVYGDTDVVCVYPPFSELADPIKEMLKKRTKVTGRGVRDASSSLKMGFFDKHCKEVRGLKYRDGEEVKNLAPDVKGWQQMVPPNIKAASASCFDELPGAEIVESAILGDLTRVELDGILGTLTFIFPEYTDPGFQAGLKKFVAAERVKQRGRRMELTGHQLNVTFFNQWCLGVEGLGPETVTDLKDLPQNWKASAVRPFIAQETLSEEDLGN